MTFELPKLAMAKVKNCSNKVHGSQQHVPSTMRGYLLYFVAVITCTRSIPLLLLWQWCWHRNLTLVSGPHILSLQKYSLRYRFGNDVDMIRSRRKNLKRIVRKYRPNIPYYVCTMNKTTICNRMMVILFELQPWMTQFSSYLNEHNCLFLPV